MDREELVPVPGGVLWTSTSGQGRPVVLCHGGPGLSDNLGEIGEMLGDVAQVHRYDQRGGGRSSAMGALGLAEHIGDLEALREHWGHERWIAGGHSWGALLALLYALEHRRRVDAVVCICIGNLWRHVEGAPAAPRRPPPAPADVHQLWLRSFADRARGEAVLASGPLYRFPRNEQVVGAVSVDLERRIGRDFDRELAALEVPVLILHGTEDHNLRAAERLALALGRATLRILPRTAHVPWLEDPPAVRAALRGFLDAGG